MGNVMSSAADLEKNEKSSLQKYEKNAIYDLVRKNVFQRKRCTEVSVESMFEDSALQINMTEK